MAVTYYPSDLTVISTWAHVAEAWHNCLTNVLHVKVAVGETNRIITFDLDGRNNSPVNVRSWAAHEIARTVTELRDIEAVRRRLTA